MRSFEVIRDPLWDNITLDDAALSLVDSAPFQRLRYVRQLGHAFLVYPGATHSRFEHALGAYHLTKRALATLELRGELTGIKEEERLAVTLAALLHDIGHYPFSHALEEAGFPSHEAQGETRLGEPPLAELLIAIGGAGFSQRVADLIRGRSRSPLQGLISGSLDLDKVDYLCRDSRACGVPYGIVDVDRLLASLTMVQAGPLGGRTLGVQEKGVSALESLLFAKYQMFRNVYWHHAVRSATALYKRIVEEAVSAGLLDPEELVGPTDEQLIYEIARRATEDDSDVAERLATRWIPALRHRRLPKRALELTAADLQGRRVEDWAVGDSPWKRAVEDELALELGLQPGEVMIDFPHKRAMFQLDLLIERRSGAVQRLGPGGLPGLLDLPKVAEELYRAARVLRVFTFERRDVPLERV